MKHTLFILVVISVFLVQNVYGFGYREYCGFNNYESAKLSLERYSLDNSNYYRASLEGFAVYRTNFGLYALASYSRPMFNPDWVKLGYIIRTNYALAANVAVTYDYIFRDRSTVKFLLGFGSDTGKSALGPMAGVFYFRDRLNIKLLGLYGVLTPFKSEYSQEYLDKYRMYGNPVYIRGFDPNSWWRFDLAYKINENFEAGLKSERFYVSGVTAAYRITEGSQETTYFKNLKIRTIVGQNLEFKKFIVFLGLSMNI